MIVGLSCRGDRSNRARCPSITSRSCIGLSSSGSIGHHPTGCRAVSRSARLGGGLNRSPTTSTDLRITGGVVVVELETASSLEEVTDGLQRARRPIRRALHLDRPCSRSTRASAMNSRSRRDLPTPGSPAIRTAPTRSSARTIAVQLHRGSATAVHAARIAAARVAVDERAQRAPVRSVQPVAAVRSTTRYTAPDRRSLSVAGPPSPRARRTGNDVGRLGAEQISPGADNFVQSGGEIDRLTEEIAGLDPVADTAICVDEHARGDPYPNGEAGPERLVLRRRLGDGGNEVETGLHSPPASSSWALGYPKLARMPSPTNRCM